MGAERPGELLPTSQRVGTAILNAAYGTQKFIRNTAAAAIRQGESLPGIVPLLDVTGTLANLLETTDQSGLVAHSPIEQAKKLIKYSESYDLKSYEKYAQDAADSIKNSASSLLAQTPDTVGNRSVDILKLGEFGQSIKTQAESIKNNPGALAAHNDMVQRLNTTIGNRIPLNELMSANGEQRAFLQLAKEIAADRSPDYRQPQQIINVHKQLYEDAKNNLKKNKEEATRAVKALLPSDPQFKGNLVETLGIGGLSPDAQNKRLEQEMANMVAAIEESYTKAETSLKESFEGKPASKDKDNKDVPAVQGLNQKVSNQKEKSEADLLLRADRLELLEQTGKVNLGSTPFSAHRGPTTTPKNRLKGVTSKDLAEYQFQGMFGAKTIEEKTKTGTKLEITTEANGNVKVSMPISAPWFNWDKSKMETDFNDMVDRVIAQDKETPSIEFVLHSDNKELKQEMILNAYKAAREKGFEPSQITFKITGNDEDNNEATKYNGKTSSNEVLQLAGLGQLEEQLQSTTLRERDQQKAEANRLMSGVSPGDTKEKVQELRNAATTATTPAAGGGGPDEGQPVFRI